MDCVAFHDDPNLMPVKPISTITTLAGQDLEVFPQHCNEYDYVQRAPV